MWRGSGGLVLVACVLAAAAGGPTRLLTSSLAFLTGARNGANASRHHNHTSGANDPHKGPRPHTHLGDGLGQPSDQDDGLRAARELLLSRFLRSAEGKMLSMAAGNGSEGGESHEGQGVSSFDKWQCLVEWMRAHDRLTSKKGQRTCEEPGEGVAVDLQEKMLDECAPVLFLVIPSLCNGTNSCINVTEASLESFLHRYWLWDRKRKRREESTDAVIYIVVVLAFYSFGIVFMMANFVRQEQRELEETKLYKQYVKLARDRWLTSRGSLANRLALQALNTLNAVPQTTDVNKVTFV